MNIGGLSIMTDKQAIKGHPAFLAYGGNNTKSVDVTDTQLGDADKDKIDATADSEKKVIGGGEGGKA